MPEIGRNEGREVVVVSCRELPENDGNGRERGVASSRKMAKMGGGKELPRDGVTCERLLKLTRDDLS